MTPVRGSRAQPTERTAMAHTDAQIAEVRHEANRALQPRALSRTLVRFQRGRPVRDCHIERSRVTLRGHERILTRPEFGCRARRRCGRGVGSGRGRPMSGISVRFLMNGARGSCSDECWYLDETYSDGVITSAIGKRAYSGWPALIPHARTKIVLVQCCSIIGCEVRF
jgi:hypothetical protein